MLLPFGTLTALRCSQLIVLASDALSDMNFQFIKVLEEHINQVSWTKEM